MKRKQFELLVELLDGIDGKLGQLVGDGGGSEIDEEAWAERIAKGMLSDDDYFKSILESSRDRVPDYKRMFGSSTRLLGETVDDIVGCSANLVYYTSSLVDILGKYMDNGSRFDMISRETLSNLAGICWQLTTYLGEYQAVMEMYDGGGKEEEEPESGIDPGLGW